MLEASMYAALCIERTEGMERQMSHKSLIAHCGFVLGGHMEIGGLTIKELVQALGKNVDVLLTAEQAQALYLHIRDIELSMALVQLAMGVVNDTMETINETSDTVVLEEVC